MDYRQKIGAIKSDYLKGIKTYEQAKSEVDILLVEMNEKGKKIAKEHGRSFTKLTFNYVFR